MVDWKKEISIGRKQPAEPASGPEPARTSVWKREVKLTRKPKQEPSADAVEVEAEAAEPVLELAPAPEPEPEPAAVEAEEPDLGDYGWLTAAMEADDGGARSWTDRVDEPTPLEAAAPPPPVTAAPVPPRPAVPPRAAGIHPPVPSAQLPPLPGPPAASAPEPQEEKPSVLKRELSFRRKPKAEQAQAESRERTDGEKKPRLKRELSFGRSKEAKEPKPERAPKLSRAERKQQPKPPKPPKQPRLKGKAKGASFKQRKVVGLKIGASQLAAARIENNGAAHLLQLARQDLEPGIVVGGELRDPEALAGALKAFFKEHKLPKKGVRLGIANNRIGVRTFDLTGILDPKQLANAIRFRAQEALPIPIEEAVLDYQILSEATDEEGEVTRKILLVVAYRDLVDRYVDACKRAGIQLAGIDLEAFALLRALVAPPDAGAPAPEAAMVAVSIGHDRTTFAVSNGQACEFTRVLDWGGASLDVALARALDRAPSETQPLKEALGIDGETVPEGLTADQVTAAREAIARQVQTFARELVSSLQFYQNQPGSLGIAELTITGGTAHLAGLADELQRLIGVPVRIGDPLARLRVGKRVADDARIGSLAVAIGLGIED